MDNPLDFSYYIELEDTDSKSMALKLFEVHHNLFLEDVDKEEKE
jgi:hypothetical protein